MHPSWPGGRVAGWPGGRVAGWPGGRVAGWPGGRVAGWPGMADGGCECRVAGRRASRTRPSHPRSRLRQRPRPPTVVHRMRLPSNRCRIDRRRLRECAVGGRFRGPGAGGGGGSDTRPQRNAGGLQWSAAWRERGMGGVVWRGGMSLRGQAGEAWWWGGLDGAGTGCEGGRFEGKSTAMTTEPQVGTPAVVQPARELSAGRPPPSRGGRRRGRDRPDGRGSRPPIPRGGSRGRRAGWCSPAPPPEGG